MKIAISGKGGVGKTTFAAFLARALARRGRRVIAIDADPDANLASALGYMGKVVPISSMKELIQERTGSGRGAMGSFFKLNPRVDDLPGRFSVDVEGIRFMVLGGVETGGGGCFCPESALLRTLLGSLILAKNETVVLDMDAGLEHLGRGTARAVDHMVVVTEPGRRSVETAMNTRRLAAHLGMSRIWALGNKLRTDKDRSFLEEALTDFRILGFLPFTEQIIRADMYGLPPFRTDPTTLALVDDMLNSLETSAAS